MNIYEQEKLDGLEEKIIASNSIAYASQITKNDLIEESKIKNKISASINDSDLYYVQSILVSSSWNRNDDIFDKEEVWLAKNTPEDKPTNLEHDENLIIGHITSNWPIDENGNIISDDVKLEDLPEKFHIVTGSVIYRSFSSPELKDRSEKLIQEIEQGNKYVSMECYFKGFDYGLVNKSSGEFKVLERNEDTAFLTRYLRAYGGAGEHEDYKIGRVLRNITFSGKGFVDKPANPDSIIFSRDTIAKLLEKKNDTFSKSGVIKNNPSTQAEMENIIMSESTEKEVAEINVDTETVSASCEDQIQEVKTLASELENDKEVLINTNQKLEAAMKEKDQEITEANLALEELKASSEKLLSEKTAEYEEAAKKYAEDMKKKDEEMEKMKAELDATNEVLAAYKAKEEEMIMMEKKMKRKASLTEAGLEDDAASDAIEKFNNLDDNSFDAMVSLLAAMKPKKAAEDEPAKKEEEAMMMKKPRASEDEDDAEAALETVEAEESIDLTVGGDDSSTESAEASIREELIEFVSARLSKNSK